MWTFVTCTALGVLAAAFIAAPFLLPWSTRVRYLVVAPMIDPWTGLGLAPRLDMRPVTLSAVESDHGNVAVTLEETDTRNRSPVLCASSACVPSVLAKLDGWMALSTTLLMIVDDGHVHLYGPDGAVTNLTPANAQMSYGVSNG